MCDWFSAHGVGERERGVGHSTRVGTRNNTQQGHAGRRCRAAAAYASTGQDVCSRERASHARGRERHESGLTAAHTFYSRDVTSRESKFRRSRFDELENESFGEMNATSETSPTKCADAMVDDKHFLENICAPRKTTHTLTHSLDAFS